LPKVADNKSFGETAQICHVASRVVAGRRRSVAAVCSCLWCEREREGGIEGGSEREAEGEIRSKRVGGEGG
jgi:hypothetical protein